MKYLCTLLCLFPCLSWGQVGDTLRTPVFKLTLEVRDIDTEMLLSDFHVRITDEKGKKTECTTNVGLAVIEKFIERGHTYKVKVCGKGYLSPDQQDTLVYQFTTVNVNKSTEFWKVLKFRKLRLRMVDPVKYDYETLKPLQVYDVLPEGYCQRLDHFLQQAKQQKNTIVLLVQYRTTLSENMKKQLYMTKEYLTKRYKGRDKVVIVESKGTEPEGIYIKTM